MKRFPPLSMCVVILLSGTSGELFAAPDAPSQLRCEFLDNPLGIDVERPRLSWVMTSDARGARQTACQIQVASSADRLADGKPDLWDSSRVESSDSALIRYAGKPLVSRTHAFWRVRLWDEHDHPSPWSDVAHWSMGLLRPTDWRAKWIGEAADSDTFQPANNGYHSEFTKAADGAKWLVIDLGAVKTFDEIRLCPARPYNWREDVPGFMFPIRFHIESANNPEFADATKLVDRTAQDVPNPGVESLRLNFDAATARYVRLSVTKLAHRGPGEFGLALAEVEVLRDGANLAEGASVSASDSIENNDWSRARLVDGDKVSHGPKGMNPLTPPLLRKAFPLRSDAAIRRATVYVTAQGFYALRLNGERVGDHQLAPEWTDYNKRIQYQTFDVTSQLRAGGNVVVAQLADGWFAGRIGLAGIAPGGRPRAFYGRRPRLLMQVEVEYDDGDRVQLISDDSWKFTTEGPLRQADLLDGDIYDARRRIQAVDSPSFDDSTWPAAATFDDNGAERDAQMNDPIRVTREIKPIAVSEPRPGVFVVDMGQNMVGWCRLRVSGKPGQQVTLRHAEVLNPDGTIYTENLRAASQTDIFTFASNGIDTFEPQFTYHGFRYVELTGLTAKPALSDVTGRVLHSAPPIVSEFECSDALLNKLWANIRWTQRANMMSVPTDCPQRDERMGWTGDILAFAQTACFNMNMAAFYEKWMRDMRDAQTKDGRFPDFAPHPYNPEARFSGVPAWGDAGVFVPWAGYVNYGDKRIIRKNLDAMKAWIDWIHRENPELLWKNKRNNDYGDWLNADTLRLDGWPEHGAEMPKEVFATAFFARSTELVSRMAAAIDQTEDARRYGELAKRIREAFNHAYVDEAGRIAGDTQAGYAIALAFDLLPKEKRAAAAKRMVETFERYDGAIATGFHSTICLMNELTAAGYNEEAYRLIGNRRMPSWGYAIDHGATTIWERWDGYVEGRGYQNPGMNSFAHYALGSVGEWMMRSVVGINPDPSHPGYAQIVIRPAPGGAVKWARGSLDTMRGRVECAWRIEKDAILLDVRIPANASAIVHVPTSDVDSVMIDGRPIAETPDVSVASRDTDSIAILAPAGQYELKAAWTK